MALIVRWATIRNSSLIVERFPVCYPLTDLSVIRHEPDSRFLECALAGSAEFIVKGTRLQGTLIGSSVKRPA
jgi:hypothetical protein